MNKKYFSLERTNQTATINIYGDITSWEWFDTDVSAAKLSKQLEAIGDVDKIDVFINSYGGEVAEGLAIYNALRRHPAQVTTYCDGFAASIASVIFMAGDNRVMNEASLLMIHNAWTNARGNAEELRKQADDLEIITQASIEAYKAHSNLTQEEIQELLDAETWILPETALEYGFATSIDRTEEQNANQNVRQKLVDIIKAQMKAEEPDDEEVTEEQAEDEETEEEPAEPETTDDESEEETEDEEETPSDDETTEDDPETDGEEDANQKLVGFFNAILKM